MRKLLLSIIVSMLATGAFANEDKPMSEEEFVALINTPLYDQTIDTVMEELAESNTQCSASLPSSKKFKDAFPNNNWKKQATVKEGGVERTLLQGCQNQSNDRLAIIKVVGLFVQGKNGVVFNVTSIEIDRNYTLE